MIIWASYILYILHLTILRFVLRKAVGNWLKNYIWFFFSKIVYIIRFEEFLLILSLSPTIEIVMKSKIQKNCPIFFHHTSI